MYINPIEIIMEDIKRSIDTNTMRILQGYNINVDKDELIKALSYDRDQYNKGYEDAKKDVLSTIDNFISMDEYYHPESKHKNIPIGEIKYRINKLPYKKPDIWWEYFNGEKDEEGTR